MSSGGTLKTIPDYQDQTSGIQATQTGAAPGIYGGFTQWVHNVQRDSFGFIFNLFNSDKAKDVSIRIFKRQGTTYIQICDLTYRVPASDILMQALHVNYFIPQGWDIVIQCCNLSDANIVTLFGFITILS